MSVVRSSHLPQDKLSLTLARKLPFVWTQRSNNYAVLSQLPRNKAVLGVAMSRSYRQFFKDKHNTTTHHRKPRSLGGKSEPRNLSELIKDHHVAWHCLFHNWTPEQIAHAINTYFLDPDYEFVCVRKR